MAEKCRERPIFIAGWTPGRIGNYKKKAFLPAFASFYIFPSLGGEGIDLFRHSALDVAFPSRWLVSARTGIHSSPVIPAKAGIQVMFFMFGINFI
ncbi:MAG: hypothetical protein NT009_13970 [Proteobacteria bacterium]|nr:hypothetical protein [Pseudomonadota bacterium]